MKILFVISCLSYGGAEKNLMILANYFKTNHQVAICNFNEREKKQSIDASIRYYEQEKWVSSGKKFDWVNMRLRQYRFLKKACKDFKPTVVVSFLPMPNTLAVLCGKRLRIPVVISERADPYQNFTKLDAIEHFIYGFADGAVFQTHGAKEFYQRKLQKKSVVIPNPVVASGECLLHDYQSAKKQIVCVGRFEKRQKRQDLAIEAMTIIHQSYPEYKMVFWGDGEDLEQVKKQVTTLQLNNYVQFAGVTDNTLESINEGDIYLLTSDYEGIPNTLIEAMSLGMPCVSTDCSPGGAKLLLGNNKYGLLVPCGDVNAIAKAITYFIENKSIAMEYGKKAKESLERFDYNTIVKKWELYLKNIVGGES